MNESPLPSRLLRDGLQQARDELARRAPDSAQDAAVLDRLLRLQALHQRQLQPQLATAGGLRRGLRQAAWGGVWLTGAMLLLATALLLIEPPRLTPRTPSLPVADSGFLPVVSQAEWQQAMAGDAQAAVWLMPTEMPRERLALLGLPYDAARADEPLRAELMVHANGQLLAVRFLQ